MDGVLPFLPQITQVTHSYAPPPASAPGFSEFLVLSNLLKGVCFPIVIEETRSIEFSSRSAVTARIDLPKYKVFYSLLYFCDV